MFNVYCVGLLYQAYCPIGVLVQNFSLAAASYVFVRVILKQTIMVQLQCIGNDVVFYYENLNHILKKT